MRLKQFAINGLPLTRFSAQPEIILMGLNQLVWLPEGVAGIAAPAVTGRVISHPGTHGVEFDVTVAGEQIMIRLYQTGVIAAFPQRAAAAVGVVDVADIASAEGLHDAAHSCYGSWCQQQVDMIGHEYIGVY